MKKLIIGLFFCGLLAAAAVAQFSFYLIDNFEDGNFTENPRWYVFGEVKAEITRNATPEAHDLVAESCGDYSLALSGESRNWYVGGVGTDLNIDAAKYSRLQIDIYGSGEYFGKLKIELFDDDNNNYILEQDSSRDWLPTKDDKWVVELPIMGKGFTRYSVPFTAFKLENPGHGDGVWNPGQKNGSGGLLKLQLVALTDKQQGKVNFRVDNVLLTY